MTSQPVSANCDTRFTAAYHGGIRAPADTVKWIVLHDEEASSAESAARYFTTKAAKGSAHLCVDDSECFRCLPNKVIAYGAPGANERGFHIEQAGFGKWSLTTWLLHRQTLRRAAYKTAYHCALFNIPPSFVFASGLALGKPGVTTHAECSKAFGGDHTDPGLFWPRRTFMGYVREYYAQLNV